MMQEEFSMVGILSWVAGRLKIMSAQIIWAGGLQHPAHLSVLELRGLLVAPDGKPLGRIVLYPHGLEDEDPFAELWLREGGRVGHYRLPYRGAYLWPQDVLGDLWRPLYARGRRVAPKQQEPTHPRPRRNLRRRVVRD